jgi:dipeptidyl aminopeptidase/acylaminoacyl peptidase
VITRDDQGEGYEGYGPMQVWVADLNPAPGTVAASRVRRVTQDNFWYGDPQWSPDGSFLVVCANRTADQESVRYSINHNYDLWKIALRDDRLEQLTTGPGPEFSPRISPDGRRIVCLSSPRRGPHLDVYNLMLVDLTAQGPRSRVVFDQHGPGAEASPHLPPAAPLPEDCWRDNHRVAFLAYRGLQSESQCVDLDTGPRAIRDLPPAVRRSPLLPQDNPGMTGRLVARDEILRWKSSDGMEIDGVLTLPPPSLARPPFKLLVLPHGGPHGRVSSGAGFDVQIFAMNGFAVFQPNFRGSIGYGLKFLDADRRDFGGGDMRDILTGIDTLVSRGIADPKREYVYGASYGGFMTAWLVGHERRFRAAVAQNAPMDLAAMWYLSDLPSWTEWEFGGRPWEIPDRMRYYSPLTYVSQVRTPTLILSSLNDRRCPIPMNRMFYRGLKEAGVETEMVTYSDEGHGLRQLRHHEDELRRVLGWFQRHDLPESR